MARARPNSAAATVMTKMAMMTAASLMAVLAACGPAPERQADTAPEAGSAPAPEPTEKAADEAKAQPTASVAPESPERPRRRRGPDGGDQTLRSLEQRMLAGFETPNEGEIYIDGKPMSAIPPHLRPVNMVFQSYAIFPHLDVGKNIQDLCIGFQAMLIFQAADLIFEIAYINFILNHSEKYFVQGHLIMIHGCPLFNARCIEALRIDPDENR